MYQCTYSGKAKNPTNLSIKTIRAIVNHAFIANITSKSESWVFQQMVLGTCVADLLTLSGEDLCLSSVQPWRMGLHA